MKKQLSLLLVLASCIAAPLLGDATDDLFEAIRNLDVASVEKALKAGANVHAVNEYGLLALHIIVNDAFIGRWKYSEEYPKIIKLLIENGAKLNAKSSRGSQSSTVLHSAIINNTVYGIPNIELIKLLIENGAGLNATNSMGNTALDEMKTQELENSEHVEFFLEIEKALRNPADHTDMNSEIDRLVWSNLYHAILEGQESQDALISAGAELVKAGRRATFNEIMKEFFFNDTNAERRDKYKKVIVKALDDIARPSKATNVTFTFK